MREVPVYLSHLRELLHQKTEEDYCEVLEELRENWSEAFLTYYTEVLDEKVYIYSFIVWGVISAKIMMAIFKQLEVCLI